MSFCIVIYLQRVTRSHGHTLEVFGPSDTR
jgi:hypothetical protein